MATPTSNVPSMAAAATISTNLLEEPNDPATELQDKAGEAIQQRDFKSAIEHLQKAVVLKPQDEEAFFNLGFAYARNRQTNEAIESYQKCLELVPTYAEAHNNLGNLMLAQRRFEEAASHFRTAITNQPESASAFNNLGKCFAIQSKLDEAIPLFREAIRLEPKNWEAHYNLAVAYLSQGHLEESEAELKFILAENPRMNAARSTLARVQRLLNRPASSTGRPPLKN